MSPVRRLAAVFAGVVFLSHAATAQTGVHPPDTMAARVLGCTSCHGTEGRGDGVAANGLSKRPEDLSRIAPPPIFPDGVVAYRIIHGKRTMPAFGQTLSENEIWDLMNFIRSLKIQ